MLINIIHFTNMINTTNYFLKVMEIDSIKGPFKIHFT